MAILLTDRSTGGADNAADNAVSVSVQLADLPGGGLSPEKEYEVRDLWKHDEVATPGVVAGGAVTLTVPPRGSVFYKLTPKYRDCCGFTKAPE